jgi:hypothetical protein
MPLDVISWKNTPYGTNIDWSDPNTKWATSLSNSSFSLGDSWKPDPETVDFWTKFQENPSFTFLSPTGSSSQSSSRDPFGGLANAFRPASTGANPMAGFNVGEMIAGAMAMGAIQRSKDRMIDAYWNRAGNEMRKEFMTDDLFNIAPLAKEQIGNLAARDRIEEQRAQEGWMAKQDRYGSKYGTARPLAGLIPTRYGPSIYQMPA